MSQRKASQNTSSANTAPSEPQTAKLKLPYQVLRTVAMAVDPLQPSLYVAARDFTIGDDTWVVTKKDGRDENGNGPESVVLIEFTKDGWLARKMMADSLQEQQSVATLQNEFNHAKAKVDQLTQEVEFRAEEVARNKPRVKKDAGSQAHAKGLEEALEQARAGLAAAKAVLAEKESAFEGAKSSKKDLQKVAEEILAGAITLRIPETDVLKWEFEIDAAL